MCGFKSGKDNPNFGKDLSGPNNARWKGGRIRSNGRWMIKMPEHYRANSKGYVYEYVLILEKKLGRLLKQGEICHHLDGNCDNNEPENLSLTRQKEHTRSHKIKDMSGRICCNCGSEHSKIEILPSGYEHEHWYAIGKKFMCKRCYMHGYYYEMKRMG